MKYRFLVNGKRLVSKDLRERALLLSVLREDLVDIRTFVRPGGSDKVRLRNSRSYLSSKSAVALRTRRLELKRIKSVKV